MFKKFNVIQLPVFSDRSNDNRPLCQIRNPCGMKETTIELMSDGLTIAAKFENKRTVLWKRTRVPPIYNFSNQLNEGECFNRVRNFVLLVFSSLPKSLLTCCFSRTEDD